MVEHLTLTQKAAGSSPAVPASLCIYCKRPMLPTGTRAQLEATRDHIVPRSKARPKDRIYGGIVWCCRQCNEIKSDMMPEDWIAFMASIPRWWEHPQFKDCGKPGAQLTYRAWQQEEWRARREYVQKLSPEPNKHVEQAKLAIIPRAESTMIMRHGKDYWRAWKLRGEPVCECCQPR